MASKPKPAAEGNATDRHPAHDVLDELETKLGQFFNGVVNFGEAELKELVGKARELL